jgi:hypothetical protein
LVVDKKKDGSDGYKPSRFSFVVLPSVFWVCFISFPSAFHFVSWLEFASIWRDDTWLLCFLLHTSPFVFLSFPFRFVVSVFDSLRSDILDILLHDLAWFGVRCFMPWPGE